MVQDLKKKMLIRILNLFIRFKELVEISVKRA